MIEVVKKAAMGILWSVHPEIEYRRSEEVLQTSTGGDGKNHRSNEAAQQCQQRHEDQISKAGCRRLKPEPEANKGHNANPMVPRKHCAPERQNLDFQSRFICGAQLARILLLISLAGVRMRRGGAVSKSDRVTAALRP
jgi:hypothetical protein